MSTLRVNKIYRVLVIALTLFSVEAKSAGFSDSIMAYTQGTNCNSFANLLHKVNIFDENGADPRVVQARTDTGKMFAPIGFIATSNPVPSVDKNDIDPSNGQRFLRKERGTSFLISPCYALTNYHAVFGSSNAPSNKFTATFYDFDPEEKTHKQTRVIPVAWGNFADGKIESEDWALVKLDVCVGKRIGWLETDVRKTGELYNKEVAIAGYPGDKKITDLWMQASCRLVEYNQKNFEGTFFHDCASRPGASGSPLFDLENGYPQVLALNSADLHSENTILHSYTHDKANIAIDIRTILPKIQSILSEDKRSFGGKNPSLPPEVLAAMDKPTI